MVRFKTNGLARRLKFLDFIFSRTVLSMEPKPPCRSLLAINQQDMIHLETEPLSIALLRKALGFAVTPREHCWTLTQSDRRNECA
jgi:hypothetical protein